MPLIDNEFNKCKCGFKIIQYFNLHKPVVASGVGVNSVIVGDCGGIADSDEQWAVLELAGEPFG